MGEGEGGEVEVVLETVAEHGMMRMMGPGG